MDFFHLTGIADKNQLPAASCRMASAFCAEHSCRSWFLFEGMMIFAFWHEADVHLKEANRLARPK